ncbi:MAG: hypothetical protein ACNYPI_11515 [Arenicellales bacterium WSBS_2016_MAG_OTU3]
MNCYVGSHAAGALIYYGAYPEYCSMSFLVILNNHPHAGLWTASS